MKRATRKLRAHRSLALAARRAAGAFCRRHLKPTLPCRAPLWTPALLRWARKRGGARASASPRDSASTVAWTSHLHLHFALAGPFRVASASGRAYADGSARGLQTSRPLLRFFSGSGDRVARSLPEPTRMQRHLAGGFGTWMPAAMQYAAGVDRVGRSASAVHQPLGLPGRLGLRVDLRPSALSGSHLIVQGRLPRSIGAAQSTRLFGRARTRSPSLSRASAGQSFRQANLASPLNGGLEPARDVAQIRRQIQRIWRARNAEATVIHASPRLQALAMKRPVDLVWRSNTSAAATVGNLPRSAMTSASSASFAESTPAAAPPGRKIDKTVVCASALDPVLADRLADDVIRRIDHRARIERERRGP